MNDTTRAAFQAVARGFQAIPIAPRSKKPIGSGWQHRRWEPDATQADVDHVFEEAHKGFEDNQQMNLGVLLGDPSHRLLDVDLDHPRTARLKDYFLPPTPARSGRAGKPGSHYWYFAEEGTVPGTRQYLMPKTEEGNRGAVIVELRSTGAQTMIPPSLHDKTGERYMWANEPWGGAKGPAIINGRRLQVQVALLALCSILVDNWPNQGSRHEAYLALAGGLLRDGDNVHPYWEQNAAVLIAALADVTYDDDGPDARVAESIGTTIKALKTGKPATGFHKLSEILGDRVVDQIRILVGEVESAAGVTSRQAPTLPAAIDSSPATVEAGDRIAELQRARDESLAGIPLEARDPLEERLGSWDAVDIEPYLTGRVEPVAPSVMEREDGQHLMYPGRVNMLYGSSESAKSWIALYTCMQEMQKGQRVLYIDFEDEPVNTLSRLMLMGADKDTLRFNFGYVRPEDPLQPMQINRWGQRSVSEVGSNNWTLFQRVLETYDPAVIVADGMTVLYGLHGLDTNDASSTDIITNWLKSLTRNGRSTVILIDHTGKSAERGTLPIGSQHKQAMVQGTMLQVWTVVQPMPGALGEVEILVLKDRPGQVRKASTLTGVKMQSAARVVIDSRDSSITTLSILKPNTQTQKAASGNLNLSNQKAAADAQLLQNIRDSILLTFHGKLGTQKAFTEVVSESGLSDKQARSGMLRLIDEGWLIKVNADGKPDPKATNGAKYELMIGGGGYDLDNSAIIDLTSAPDPGGN